MKKKKYLTALASVLFVLAPGELRSTDAARRQDQRGNQQRPQMQPQSSPRAEGQRRAQAALIREVRSALAGLPYYDVFDWLEFEVRPDGTIVLRGQVVAPPDTKSAAERAVKEIEGVSRVVNEIETLPVSPNDERLRVALFRAIYNFDSPLFRYATRAVPPIHIIVRNGRATLKGVVANESDSTLANIAARGVPGLFEVKNELQVENARPR